MRTQTTANGKRTQGDANAATANEGERGDSYGFGSILTDSTAHGPRLIRRRKRTSGQYKRQFGKDRLRVESRLHVNRIDHGMAFGRRPRGPQSG
jgi:hypothetical protein